MQRLRHCGIRFAVAVISVQLLGLWFVYIRWSPWLAAVSTVVTSNSTNASLFIAGEPPWTSTRSYKELISNRKATGAGWRAAFDYCKDPPPCVLDPARQTDARSSDIVLADERDPLARWVVTAGEPFVLVIRARDANGDDRGCGGDSFQVDIRGPGVFQGFPVDRLDGTYALSVVLFDAGDYEVRGRLDYRACQGLSRCDSKNITALVFEFVGRDGGQTLTVRHSARANANVADDAGASNVRGILYRTDVAFNDASYFKGRWQDESLTCGNGSAIGRSCYAGVPHRSPLVWHPIDDGRPVLPLASLRGKWVHSIGDSISRNLNSGMAQLLGRLGVRCDFFCVYRNFDGADLVTLPNGTKSLESRKAWAKAPLLILERQGCESSAKSITWVDDATGRVFEGRYILWWMWHQFPDLDFTMTQHWMTFQPAPVSVRYDHPPYFTFKTWTHAPFLRFVDQHKTFWGSPLTASANPRTAPVTGSPAPTGAVVLTPSAAGGANNHVDVPAADVSATLVLSSLAPAHIAAAGVPPTTFAAPASHVIEPVMSQDVATRSQRDDPQGPLPVRVEVVDSAALRGLFAERDPTVLLVNKGLHHVSDDYDPHLDVDYESHVLELLRSLRKDFPQSTILWRSTATTQWRKSALPQGHKCRTPYRVAFANERAASAIVAFNREEEAGGRAPVRVLDYYQISLGRPDAAPDNRHYNADVEAAVVDELLNILANDAS